MVDPQQLFVTLYDELRRLAQRKLRQEGAAQAMGATTLLHEVYLTVQARHGVAFPDRARFLAYASRAMRGLIIDFTGIAQPQREHEPRRRAQER
jgi:DNA-directed RNA polymerase specialized sigma24 family protein